MTLRPITAIPKFRVSSSNSSKSESASERSLSERIQEIKNARSTNLGFSFTSNTDCHAMALNKQGPAAVATGPCLKEESQKLGMIRLQLVQLLSGPLGHGMANN